MKIINNAASLILLFSSCFSLFTDHLRGQDTTFVFPSQREVDVSLSSTVKKYQNDFIYAYQIRNNEGSRQNLEEFFVEFASPVNSLSAPTGWLGLISNVRKRVVMWGSNDSTFDIMPNSQLEGFVFRASALPTIVSFYARGAVEEPSFPEGEAPPLELTVGLDIFENSKQGRTIGPIDPPSPFAPLQFLDTLTSYTSQSSSLGWITNIAVADKYRTSFTTAKTQIQQRNIPAARSTLETILQQADQDSSTSLSSEAYALIRFNTEYLLQKLAEQEQVTIDDLISMKHQAETNGWIGDKNFVNELDNHLENARKHLQKRDSTNAYKEVEQFQQKVNKEYERTVEREKKNQPRDKRFVTVEGWNLLYPNAQKVLDSLSRKEKKSK